MIFTRRFERTVKKYFIRNESKSRKGDLISRLAFFSPSNNFGSTQNKLIKELDIDDDPSIFLKLEGALEFIQTQGRELKVLRIVQIDSRTSLEADFERRKIEAIQAIKSVLPNVTIDYELIELKVRNLNFGQLDYLIDALTSQEPTFFCLSGIVDRANDPRPLLRIIRILLKLNVKNRLIFAMNLIEENPLENKTSFPGQKEINRQWTLEQLVEGFESSGFKFESSHKVQTVEGVNAKVSTFFAFSCSNEYHLKFLNSLGIRKLAEHVLIASEHSATGSSGGIGSYFSMLDSTSKKNVLVMFTGNRGIESNPIGSCQKFGWVHVRQLLSQENWPSWDQLDFEVILDACEQLIYLVDTIKIIEFPDYMGIGYRLAQASSAGLLPESVKTVCYCHGSNYYIDRGFGRPSESRDLVVDLREKISIECADYTIFPSNFLKDMYSTELNLSIRNPILLPYPIEIQSQATNLVDYTTANTILFYGKDNVHKGFPVLMECLREIHEKHPLVFSRIERVVLAGVDSSSVPKHISDNYKVECFKGSLSQAKQLLANYCARSVVILPYLGDNQPLAVFEVVESGSRLIAFNAGGIPEQIPNGFHQEILVNPNRIDLTQGIIRSLNESASYRLELTNTLLGSVRQKLQENLNRYSKQISAISQSAVASNLSNLSASAVLFVRAIDDLEERIDNLAQQDIQFSKVYLFIENESLINSVLIKNLSSFFNYEILIDKFGQNENIYWWSKALEDIDTDLVVFLDPEDRISSNYLALCKKSFMKNQYTKSVCSFVTRIYSSNLNEDESIGLETENQLGFELAFIIQDENVSDAIYCWSTSQIQSIKVPKTNERNFVIKIFLTNILIENYGIGVIPKLIASKRVNKRHNLDLIEGRFNSILELIRTLNLPISQGYGLIRLMRSSVPLRTFSDSTYLGQTPNEIDRLEMLSRLRMAERELNAVLSSRTWRYSRYLRLLIGRVKSQLGR